MTLFRVAVGIPWLEANSKDFNDFQHITKGGSKWIKRNTPEWQKYITGAYVNWLPPLSDDQMIEMALPAVPRAAPVVAAAPVQPAMSQTAFMAQLQQTKEEKRADKLMEEISRGQVSAPAAAQTKKANKQTRQNYARDGTEAMAAARQDCQVIEARTKKQLKWSVVRNVAFKNGVGVNSLWDRYRGIIDWSEGG